MANPWEQDWSKPAATAVPWEHDWTPKPPLSAGDTAIDALKAGGTGLVKGGLSLGGMVGDLTDLGAKGIEKATDLIGGSLGIETPHASESRKKASFLNYIPTSESLQKGLETVTGPLYEPKTTTGHVAETIASFVPGAVLAGGAPAANIARYAVAPGLATEAAGAAMGDSEWKPYAQAAAGIAAGSVNPARLVTPFPASEARRRMVDILQNEGVTSLTAGQRTGNKKLQYLEDATSTAPMAGHGADRIRDEGQRQFTEATVRRAGAGPDASPEVLQANSQRLGGEFDRLSRNNTLIPDNQFVTDLVEAARDYRHVPPSQQRAMVQGYLDDIVEHVNNGHMPGESYQAMRSRLSSQSKSLAQSDPMLSQTLRDMRNGLDSAMGRSISPADQEAWQAIRREYGAQRVIEKAASRAGEATAEGQITPANLRNTVAAENRGAYARGQGNFSELARAGSAVMAPLPNSGTAPRLNALNMLNAATLGIIPAATGRAVMSPPVQSYLANQLLGRGALPANQNARNLLMIEMLQRSQQPTQQPQ